ncbi:YibE/F family protein [candidate division WWE3 bacterium]|uniref:YibE/F family protein n=1 Tax=candidate division WWE3 bacterium TaxID=2053526 RepID=A0A955LGP5_UNCKA|nr:YibE/F family protein [candidate division WWE3 bacterium]
MKHNLIQLFFILIGFIFFTQLSAQSIVFAQETMTQTGIETFFEAKVIEVTKEEEITFEDQSRQLYQELKLEVLTGDNTAQEIMIENGKIPLASVVKYKTGDVVVVSEQTDTEGTPIYFITDFVRRPVLLYLLILFIVLSILIGKIWGLTSLIGMAYSFLVIVEFVLPQLLLGKDPVMIAILGSIMIIPVTFYLSHGINKKTTISIGGTIIALIVTGVLAQLFITTGHLTGLASDEAQYLKIFQGEHINMKGLLLAGIIIGALGILDDITISQASIVHQLKAANPKMSQTELIQRGMAVGRDHISSLINTLILVYTGAALPLLLLFIDNPQPFSYIVNQEIVAEEIIRTLVGTIGIIIAVPITTLLAVYIYNKTGVGSDSPSHTHAH